MTTELEPMLAKMLEADATDLHLKVASAPQLRIGGTLTPMDVAPMPFVELTALARELIPAHRSVEFEEMGECDFAHSIPGVGRFRVNVHRQRGSMGLIIRHVPPGTRPLAELNMPPGVHQLADAKHGLVVVTGPRGSGTTTTVAALIDHINQTRAVSIVTIEDPIEVLHTDKKSIVSQREVGTDLPSYELGMRRVGRHDADVVYVGELRDEGTVAAAIEAAETGQLVITTMPTPRAEETVMRIVEFFPPYQHRQVRNSLANALAGVISQRLVDRADGQGKLPAVEVLAQNQKVFDLIIDPESSPLDFQGNRETLTSVIADGKYSGMQTVDQSLLDLLRERKISVRSAMGAAGDPSELRIAIQTAGLDAGEL